MANYATIDDVAKLLGKTNLVYMLHTADVYKDVNKFVREHDGRPVSFGDMMAAEFGYPVAFVDDLHVVITGNFACTGRAASLTYTGPQYRFFTPSVGHIAVLRATRLTRTSNSAAAVLLQAMMHQCIANAMGCASLAADRQDFMRNLACFIYQTQPDVMGPESALYEGLVSSHESAVRIWLHWLATSTVNDPWKQLVLDQHPAGF